MPNSLGNLGELFPDKNISCKVRGCSNLWAMEGSAAMQAMAGNDASLPDRMCESCYNAYRGLTDREVACASPDCDGRWVWRRYQQLEATVAGHKAPPRRFCEACRSKIDEMQDRAMPCRLRGCEETWTWRRDQQMTWEAKSPPDRLCETCYAALQQFAPVQVSCRAHGCQATWEWTPYQQLECHKRGADLAQPPRRLCQDCFAKLKTLADVELPCKVKECERTWRLSAYQQLEHQLTSGPDAPPPAMMCRECHAFFQRTHDVERLCRNRGCRNTWVYTRSWQLRDRLKGRDRAPMLMCKTCTEKLAALEVKEEPCSIPGCEGTWSHSPEEQLKDACLHRREGRQRRCGACDAFLASHEATDVPCGQCSKPIPWSAYEQLLCERGTFVKPATCSDCAAQELAGHRPPPPAPADHHHIVRVPAGGRWGSNPRIAAWPPHLSHDTVSACEKADIRIVALGDDLTHSAERLEDSWPHLLESMLNEKLADEGLSTAVVNAGIPASTSAEAMQRFERDVIPFAPQIVIFSFAFADSLLWLEPHEDRWHENCPADLAWDAMEKLATRLSRTDAKPLYWSTNPMLPQDRADHSGSGRLNAWAEEQQARKSQVLAHAQRVCTGHDIPVLDLRSRFEINGQRSARKWMADWAAHNQQGARHIATWMSSYLLSEKFIDPSV